MAEPCCLCAHAPRRKLRYYKRYIQPGGLPRLHLYGVYAATTNDGDKELYSALLRCCEASGSPDSSSGSCGGSSSGSTNIEDASGQVELCSVTGGGTRAAQHVAAAAAGPGEGLQREVQAVLDSGADRVQQVSAQRRTELLQRADAQLAAEELLGMRMFLGGISHGEFHAWARRTGFSYGGGANGQAGSQVKVEL